MKFLTYLSVAVLLIASVFVSTVRADLTADPNDDGLTLPDGFHAMVAADNLGPLRFMVVAPNGDIYVRNGNILALHDSKGDGHYDVVKPFGVNGGSDTGATGIALHNGYLYYSNDRNVFRYKMTPGQMVPTGDPETIVKDLPDSGGHNAKSITFDENGNMYIEVGSPLNVYCDNDRGLGAKGKDATEFLKTFGGIWRFKSDVPNQTQSDGHHFVTGSRHTIAIAMNPANNAMFGVMMGRDQLNEVDPTDYSAEDNCKNPAEEMHLLKDGVDFGWPYTYYDPERKKRMVAPEFGGDNKKEADPGKYDEPVVAFPAHWAPLQMAFYTGKQFPSKYRGGAFIAFHGSWNRAPLPQAGYNVAYVPFDITGIPTGDYEVFADRFAGVPIINSPHDAKYRPGGLAVGPDGSLFVADTEKGRIWRIFYNGL